MVLEKWILGLFNGGKDGEFDGVYFVKILEIFASKLQSSWKQYGF